MKKRFIALICVIISLFTLTVGVGVVFADNTADSALAIKVNYANGEFLASGGYTVETNGQITPAEGLQNGYRFDADAYYTVTAPEDKAFTSAGGSLSLVFTYKSSTNVQGAENNGTEKNEQLFGVVAEDGREAYICMGGLYYRSAKGKTLQALTKDADEGYKALTTAAKEIVITLSASGINWYANGQILYSVTTTTGQKTAEIFLDVLSTPGTSLGVHKGATSKTSLMTTTVNMANLEVYGKLLDEGEIANIFEQRKVEYAKGTNIVEKFEITYENGVFKSSHNDYGAVVEGEGVVTDPDNVNAFKFTDTTSSVKIQAKNGAVLSQNGTMTIAFKQRVSLVDDSGYLENLLSAVNDKGENANICLGEMDIYRYIEGETKLTRTAIVRNAHQQVLKKEEERLIIITISNQSIHVYENGVQVQQYFGAYSAEVGEYMQFATDTFAAQLTAENGEIILRNKRSSSASWNKKVLCLSDVAFFDKEFGASEAYAYYAQKVAEVKVQGLEKDEYLSYVHGTGVLQAKETLVPNAVSFANDGSYLAIYAKNGYALTKANKGVSFHLKQRVLDVANASAEENLFAVEGENKGAYVNLGGIAYYDGTNYQTVAASNPSALLKEEWQIVSVVVNKEVSSIQVYVNGEIIENYLSNGEDSVVAKIVALFSEKAELKGGETFVRKSRDQEMNTQTLAIANLTIAEGGLSALEVASYIDALVGMIEIPVEANIGMEMPALVGESGLVIPAPTQSVDGYEFVGYYLDADHTIPVEEDATFTTAIKKLYAKYQLVTYSITYYCNGGTQSQENVDSYDILTAVTFHDIEKAGYTFEGWYRTEDFRNQVSMLLQGTTGNVELYAKFTVNVYTIDYQLNDGIMTEDNAVTSYTVEDVVVLVDAWKAHYTFDGWYADVQLENKVENFDVKQAENVTLYAKFTPVKYFITWDANGGTLEEGYATEYTVEDNFDLAIAVKEHYVLDGWYLEKDFENKVNSLKEVLNDVTLYAKYSPCKYTVTYQVDGGVLAEGAVTEYTVEDGQIVLVVAVKEGYTFGGWYLDDKFDSKVESLDASMGKNVTLYAKFDKIQSVQSCSGSVGGCMPIEVLSLLVIAVVVTLRRKWRNV